MGAPALLDGQAPGVLSRINALVALAATFVRGGAITDGGTTQSSGAGTAPNLDLDVAIVEGSIDAVPIYVAAGTDIDADSGDTVVWGATSGKEMTASVVLQTGAAGITAVAYQIVPGTVAATGLSVAPTEAEIDTAVGHTHWVLVGDVVFARTADTTITVTVTSAYLRRASLGSKVSNILASPAYMTPLAETEAAWRDYGNG